jgi:hypothetical protein
MIQKEAILRWRVCAGMLRLAHHRISTAINRKDATAMRIVALAALILAASGAQMALAQVPATFKAQGQYGQATNRAVAPANYASGGEIQQAGHRPATPYPVFDPAGPHSAGGGTFPYGSQYDAGHPGKLMDGGRYGYFGGAHRTPGYPHHHHMPREYVGPQGPPSAAVAYPYYTTRGPRDFLMDNPPSIGR